MAVSAQVVDGKIVNNGMSAAEKAEKEKETKKTGNSTLGKDAFLQLLVAQMKYQDPLEASNNSTEYVSQLATFSELESMQNLLDSAEEQRIQSLVGKSVVLDVDGKQYTGQVDYLQYEDGETKISVGGELYSVDDIYQVIDSDYLTAYTEAANFISKLYSLPKLEDLTEKTAQTVHELEDAYEGMSDYGKSFIAADALKYLEGYKARADVLSPRPEEVDYDKLTVEKLDELIGKLGGLSEDKDSLTEAIEKLAAAGGIDAASGSAGDSQPPQTGETDQTEGAAQTGGAGQTEETENVGDGQPEGTGDGAE